MLSTVKYDVDGNIIIFRTSESGIPGVAIPDPGPYSFGDVIRLQSSFQKELWAHNKYAQLALIPETSGNPKEVKWYFTVYDVLDLPEQ